VGVFFHRPLRSRRKVRKEKIYFFSVAFVFLSFKGKQKGSKLGVLCVLAVNSIHTKTLLGSPSKPPFLGVVIDFY